MWESIKVFFYAVYANPSKYFLTAFLMASAIIVFLEIIKPFVFNRIKNKEARGTVLAFSSIFLCFASVAIYFLIQHLTFEYYVYAALTLSVLCIVEYWLYEFTRLRAVIYKFGSWCLMRVGIHAAKKATGFDKDKIGNALYFDDIKAEAKKDLANVVTETEKKVRNYKDEELKNL